MGEQERSKVFCILPFVALQNAPSGAVTPCCTWAGPPLGSLRESSLSQLRNAEALKRVRSDMLAGRASPECQTCYRAEALGLLSDRQLAPDRLGFSRDLSTIGRETSADGAVPEGLRCLSVSFSNVCNLRCRTCNPRLSTGWYRDMAALRWGDVPSPPILRPMKDAQAFLSQLEPHLDSLETIHFVGGEPLAAREHYLLVERLIERGLFHIRLSYDTNFSVLGHARWDVLKIWDQFDTVSVQASLDGAGSRGDYIRKGQDWERIVRNRIRLLRESPGVKFGLLPTFSIFNSLHLPDFLRDWLEEGYVSPANIDFNMLTNPPEYCVQALPASLKARVADKYAGFVDGYLRGLGASAGPLIRLLNGTLNFMRAADQTALLPALRRSISELDRVRGESFQQVFPELAEVLSGEEPETLDTGLRGEML